MVLTALQSPLFSPFTCCEACGEGVGVQDTLLLRDRSELGPQTPGDLFLSPTLKTPPGRGNEDLPRPARLAQPEQL